MKLLFVLTAFLLIGMISCKVSLTKVEEISTNEPNISPGPNINDINDIDNSDNVDNIDSIDGAFIDRDFIDAMNTACPGIYNEIGDISYKYGATIISPLPQAKIASNTLDVSGTCFPGTTVYLKVLASPAFNAEILCSPSGTFQLTTTELVGMSVWNSLANIVQLTVTLATSPTDYAQIGSRYIVINSNNNSEIFKISTAAEFVALFNSKPAASLVLTGNLDFSSLGPIKLGNGFSGTIDGNGFEIRNAIIEKSPAIFAGTIKNLKIKNVKKITDPDSLQYSAIFGHECMGARFINLEADSVESTGENFTGIFCGNAEDTSFQKIKISNSKVSGLTFSGTLAGNMRRVIVESVSITAGSVASISTHVGGIAGNIEHSCLKANSYSGLVIGGSLVGTLAGAVTGKAEIKTGLPYVKNYSQDVLSNKIISEKTKEEFITRIIDFEGDGTVVVGSNSGGGIVGESNFASFENISFSGVLRHYNNNEDRDKLTFDPGPLISEVLCSSGGAFGSLSRSRVDNAKITINLMAHGGSGGFMANSFNSHIFNVNVSLTPTVLIYSGPLIVSCLSNHLAGFASKILPIGLDGTNSYLWDIVPGGSTIQSCQTNVTPEVDAFVASPYGGDNIIQDWIP